MQYPKEVTIIDFETTGLNPQIFHSDKIIEFAVMDEESKITSRLIRWNNLHIPEHITSITGITDGMIEKDGIEPKDALNLLLKSILGKTIVGHNIYSFDLPFLLCWLSIHHGGIEASRYYTKIVNNMVDTAVLFKARMMNEEQKFNESFIDFSKRIIETKRLGLKYSLKYICDYYKINTQSIVAHRASGDVMMTKQIYQLLNN